MGRRSSSSSTDSSSSCSSIDSSRPFTDINTDLSTDLRLGLSLSSSSSSSTTTSHHHHSYSNSRDEYDDGAAAVSDWPSIKSSVLRSSRLNIAENNNGSININIGRRRQQQQQQQQRNRPTFFVKVYMEGIPIGRKLDLFAHQGYQGLISTLTHMFQTTILYPGIIDPLHSDQDHVLTYEDKEGDLMMVGDVPWDLFLSTVKRLKITRSDKC